MLSWLKRHQEPTAAPLADSGIVLGMDMYRSKTRAFLILCSLLAAGCSHSGGRGQAPRGTSGPSSSTVPTATPTHAKTALSDGSSASASAVQSSVPSIPPTLRPSGDEVVLVGHGATIKLENPTAITRLGKARGPAAEPWDLITSCTRSGSLANAFIKLRAGTPPEVKLPPGRSMADAGLREVSSGPDATSWHVVTRRAVFPLVELPMYALSQANSREASLPIEFVTGIYFDDKGPFPGARDSTLTIVGPLSSAPSRDAVTSPDQKVVAANFDAPPHWVEHAYTYDKLEWRQRIYWSLRDNFIVRYQVPQERAIARDLLQAAAEQLARAVRARKR